jgi:hypothetical protein
VTVADYKMEKNKSMCQDHGYVFFKKKKRKNVQLVIVVSAACHFFLSIGFWLPPRTRLHFSRVPSDFGFGVF